MPKYHINLEPKEDSLIFELRESIDGNVYITLTKKEYQEWLQVNEEYNKWQSKFQKRFDAYWENRVKKIIGLTDIMIKHEYD